jgi:hypothetical protein
MPVLAQMPFSANMPHLVERRAWQLKAYQIRSGVVGIDVPVIEGEQPFGYEQAAAMQVAALAHDPSEADRVRDLRRVLRPQSVQIIHADRGIAVSSSNLPRAFSIAEAQIAARRKDYARAAALARAPAPDILIDPPTVVIDALLDEGDWRAAADIAQEHDPRKRKRIPGLTDDRRLQYVLLYDHLALAAAWQGDDAAAAAFLAQANEGRKRGDLFLDTLLAGAAEELLPRQYLHLTMPAFRALY